MSFEAKLDKIIEKHSSIQGKLVNSQNISGKEYVELTKSLSELEDISAQIKEYKKMLSEKKDLESISF